MQVLIFTLELFQCENHAQKLEPPGFADRNAKIKKHVLSSRPILTPEPPKGCPRAARELPAADWVGSTPLTGHSARPA